MGNIIRLSKKYADRETRDPEAGDRDVGSNAGDRIQVLPEGIADCMVGITGFGEQVKQSLNASRTLLAELDVTIASTRDPVQRAILQDERCQAEQTLLLNSRILLDRLEFMASSAQAIREQCCVLNALQAPDHGVNLKSGSL